MRVWTKRGLPGNRMISASRPCLAKRPVSLAIHGGDCVGLGETKATRIFSAVMAARGKNKQSHPAAKAKRIFIGLQSLFYETKIEDLIDRDLIFDTQALFREFDRPVGPGVVFITVGRQPRRVRGINLSGQGGVVEGLEIGEGK